ncbi:MAG: Crp/Fnr family transcriptional regulator [Rhodospirillales bacterium]|nr:Crp/Fnr family transcriptional regulator [Rhodospirillales bacterium]
MHGNLNAQSSQPDKVDIYLHPLFKHCDDNFIKTLGTISRKITCEKGQTLLFRGDKAVFFYLIRSGCVKLYRETIDGTLAVVDILTAGQVFCEISIFEKCHHPYNAEVVEAGEVIMIPVELLQEEIKNNHQFALDVLRLVANHCRQQERELEHRSLQNAAQRIGCFFLRLLNRREGEGGTFHLPYDKMLVASRLGMQPETFSRALAKLKKETGIHIKGSKIKVDNISNIAKYTCSACSSEFPCKDLDFSKGR